jgi:hypothetical protein
MNIKTEFEQFLASKAEEFVSRKANMTIIEFRELNAVLDTCGIDFSNLPPLVDNLKTKRIRVVTNVSPKDTEWFIYKFLGNGKSYTTSDIVDAFKTEYAKELAGHSEDTVTNKIQTSMVSLRKKGLVQKTTRIENSQAYLYRAVRKTRHDATATN